VTADETTPPDPTGEPGPDAPVEDIQADIDKTRDELGQTVEALAAKADVKGQAKQKAFDTRDRLTEKAVQTRDVVAQKATAAQSATREALTDDAGSVKPVVPVAAVIAASIVVIGIVVWRRRR
jgi:ElaB/YqjD/DUF883 family membrane-anchored ribosome-binding protein